MSTTRALAVRLAVLAPLVVIVVAASSLLGYTRISLSEIFGEPRSVSYWTLRAPRTVLAAVSGAGLAVGGAVFQILFRNPLATPYTLGVASGASLAAAVGFLYSVSGYWLGIPHMALLAFSGAVGAMALIIGLALSAPCWARHGVLLLRIGSARRRRPLPYALPPDPRGAP